MAAQSKHNAERESNYEHLWPWRVWKSPAKQARAMPTFLAIEWTYRLGSIFCLTHAVRTNGLPLWFSAWLCGTANDMFFYSLPLCDNFHQAQACVMLTPRLPLYIVEMYSVIIYMATTAARQFNLPYSSEAALTGLLAHVLYGVYDINGPPFLWWTWHDGDPAISKRQHNAPLGSSMWILTYIGLHSLLLRFCEYPSVDANVTGLLRKLLSYVLAKLPALSSLAAKFRVAKIISLLERLQGLLNKAPWAVRIGWSGLVCTPLFMMLMGVYQIGSLDKIGVPGQRTYRLALASYIALVINGFRRAHNSGSLYLPKLRKTRDANFALLPYAAIFYAVNIAVAFKGDPTKHYSTGCHQKYSDHSRVVKDPLGYNREEHVFGDRPVGHSRDDYEFPPASEDNQPDPSDTPIITPKPTGLASEWYTVKGIERPNGESDRRFLLFFSALGMLGFGTAFSGVLARRSYM